MIERPDDPYRPPTSDPSHNVWRERPNPMDSFFRPNGVAIIGASDKPNSVGRTILSNLIGQSFGGTVYPVNPRGKSLLGVPCHKNLVSIREKMDLAVIVTPAKTVPDIIEECVAAKIPSAIVISAGFKELGAPGEELERQIAESAHGRIRIIGPNCLGLMNPPLGFNATFASRIAHPGHVAFISQSGALCSAILDWSFSAHVGFSAFVSIGSMLDVGWGDLIDYLGDDPLTSSILIYMETIGNARSFLSAAREVALRKPIIVLKAGRTEAAAKAAASHTGSIAGSDAALDAAFDRCGVLRVRRIEELFDMADVLAKQTRPRGKRLAIITNAGGPGVLATDSFILDGGELAELSKETIDALNETLPAHWSHGNPIDVLGDANPERYTKTVDIISKDPNVHGTLVILTPQAMSEPTKTAELLVQHADMEHMPLLASWMGGGEVQEGRNILKRSGIPVFSYPDRAARMFSYMWRYSHNLEGLYKTPVFADTNDEPDRAACHRVLSEVKKERRTILTEPEAKQLLRAYGLPTVRTEVATTAQEAVSLAKEAGYPAVLKLFSKTVTHKTDVGGVRLDLKSAEDVKRAFDEIRRSVEEKEGSGHFLGVSVQPMVKTDGIELILGSALDAQLGPVLLFGAGGRLVEFMDDHVIALPPLNTTLALRMIEKTRAAKLLRGVRGRAPVDLLKLEKLLVCFSRLVIEQRDIREIEINPLLASSEGFVALDARAVLHDNESIKKGPPPLAIRPYPSEYIFRWKAKNGMEFTIRPIRAEDEPLMIEFHRTLSEESVRRRYFTPMLLEARIQHSRLVRVCFNDYDRDIALVAHGSNEKTSKHAIFAVARLSRGHGSEAEFSMIVSDQVQNQGLGSHMAKLAVFVARREKIHALNAHILGDNWIMQHVCKKIGFDIRFNAGGDACAQMNLKGKNEKRLEKSLSHL